MYNAHLTDLLLYTSIGLQKHLPSLRQREKPHTSDLRHWVLIQTLYYTVSFGVTMIGVDSFLSSMWEDRNIRKALGDYMIIGRGNSRSIFRRITCFFSELLLCPGTL